MEFRSIEEANLLYITEPGVAWWTTSTQVVVSVCFPDAGLGERRYHDLLYLGLKSWLEDKGVKVDDHRGVHDLSLYFELPEEDGHGSIRLVTRLTDGMISCWVMCPYKHSGVKYRIIVPDVEDPVALMKEESPMFWEMLQEAAERLSEPVCARGFPPMVLNARRKVWLARTLSDTAAIYGRTGRCLLVEKREDALKAVSFVDYPVNVEQIQAVFDLGGKGDG